MAFFTISLASDLSASARRQAAGAGPPAPEGDVADLVRRAGFADLYEQDVSAEYLDTARAWLGARLRHRDELRPADPSIYDARVADGRIDVAAIEAGVFRRTLFVGRKP